MSEIVEGSSKDPTISVGEQPVADRSIKSPGYTLHSVLTGHTDAISSVKFSPDGCFLATTANDATLCVWDVDKGQLVKRFTGHEGGISDLDWSPDSRSIVTASDDTSVAIWHLSDDILEFQKNSQGLLNKSKKKKVDGKGVVLLGHLHYVFSVAWNPRIPHIVASGSYDTTVKIWDIKRARCLMTLSGHTEPVTSVHFDREGSRLVSASWDGTVRVWDVSVSSGGGKCLRTLSTVERPPVGFAKFSPNGKFILASTWDHTIRLWGVGNERVLKSYIGHRNETFCCFAAFSVTGNKWIVSGSEDGLVYLWDLQEREIVQRLEGHTAPVLTVACHPTRNMIASGAVAGDHTVRLWVSASNN